MAKIKVELSIPSELKDEPIIYLMGSKFKLVPNIIEASFSTSMGWAVLTIEGDQQEIDKLTAFLKEKNISIKYL